VVKKSSKALIQFFFARPTLVIQVYLPANDVEDAAVLGLVLSHRLFT
jgi:hypothetical protein